MADTPLVLIRTDADATIGTGHLVRCLTLAGALLERGASVVLAARALSPPLRERVASAGIELLDLPARALPPSRPLPDQTQVADADEVLAQLGARAPDWVVVDSYALHAPWASRLRRSAAQIAVIDDLAEHEHDADLLLDQNWFGPGTGNRYDGLVAQSTRLLLGPRYALLQPEYHEARSVATPHPERSPRVAVSFGGSDPTDETSKFLDSAAEVLDGRGIRIDIVVGGAAENAPEVERRARQYEHVTLHSNLPSLAPLFAAATLGVGAGGTTTWERICLDVPALVAVVADNQASSIARLARAGVVHSLGPGATTTAATYADAVERALAGEVPQPPPLVDGYGAQRVALALLEPSDLRVRLRLATSADGPVFIGPDPGAAVGGSYLDGPTVWEQRLRSFAPGGSGVIMVDTIPSGGRTALGEWWTDASLPGVLRDRARDLLRNAPLTPGPS